MKVEIKNYQSIVSQTLEVEGLTVVVGKSNVGKSALLRSISASWFGQSGDYFIRDGTPNCEVRCVFDGLEIGWVS